MPIRKTKLAPGEYYHIYNRGGGKQNIFLHNNDFIRFLFLILYFQSPITLPHIGRITSSSLINVANIRMLAKLVKSQVDEKIVKKIVEMRYVELVGFVLMPNHFHLIVQEADENGISRYMQRVLNAYTKYFNTKYNASGHLFQGPFQAVHIDKNEQLLYLSAYIHRNARELKEWNSREHDYPWSSFQDYIQKNRWEGLLVNDIIAEQFSNGKEYQQFVKATKVKERLC